MKNVIIAGSSRAGKSTLAKAIAKKYNISYIPFDSIVSTIEKLYPGVGIAHCDENRKMSKRIAIFLEEYIKHLSYEDITYVIDLYQIFPSDLKEILNPNDHLALYLGYLDLPAKSKLMDIRKFARDKDWTKKTNDEDLIVILNKFISESKIMKDECMNENYEFFNTGINFIEAIEKAKLYISKNI